MVLNAEFYLWIQLPLRLCYGSYQNLLIDNKPPISYFDEQVGTDSQLQRDSTEQHLGLNSNAIEE